MSAYPVTYEADYIPQRNRLTVFFRLVMVIPHYFMAFFVGLAAFFTVIAAWFAVVITGKYPQGLFDFNAGVLRWVTRFNAYLYLQVDAFPPFGFDDDPNYPVRVRFAGPLPEYNRLTAFFRLIVAIPVIVIFYALAIVYGFCAIAAWFVAVITGKLPKGLHDGLDLGLAYQAKATAYLMLLTETWPPFSNEDATLAGTGPGGSLGTGGGDGHFAPPTVDTTKRPL